MPPLKDIANFNLIQEASKILNDNKEFIETLIKGQWEEGTASDNQPLAYPYADKYYAIKKANMNPKPSSKFGNLGYMDFTLTGETKESIKAELTPYAIVYTVDDKYGLKDKADGEDRMLKMDTDSRARIIDEVLLPGLIKNFYSLLINGTDLDYRASFNT